MYLTEHPKPMTRSTIRRLCSYYFFILIFIYGSACFITVSQLKLNLIEDIMQRADWPANILLTETFGRENALYNHAISKKDRPKPVYHVLLESITRIRFDDHRSLFGSELPGFTIYNTRIFAAGKGLNYTNLPQDDPPPADAQIEKPAPKERDQQQDKPVNEKLKKTVLIYHTHPWESYEPINNGKATTTNPDKSVAINGDEISDILARHGIGTIHLIKQGWGYNEAYASSRVLVQQALKKTPTLNYLLDIHRDSSNGKLTTSKISGVSYARISMVIGEANPNYSANLYLAKQIKSKLDKSHPTLVRGIVGKTKLTGNGVYNQDLSKNALLIEIGGVDNDKQEIIRSAKAFAEALLQVIKQNK